MKLSERFPKNVSCIVIQVRGTNFTGKSTVVKHIIDKFGTKKILSNDIEQNYGMQLKRKVAIVGKVTRNGYNGCDGLKCGQEGLKNLVVNLAKKNRIVVFEGAIHSHLYSGYVDLAQRLKKNNAKLVWAYLDTPLKVILKRVALRRKAANKKPPKMAEKRINMLRATINRILKEHNLEFKEHYPFNTIRDFEAVAATKMKATRDGECVVVLKYKNATDKLYRAIKAVLNHAE